MRPARLRPFHGGRCALWGRGGARWEGWNSRGLVCRRKSMPLKNKLRLKRTRIVASTAAVEPVSWTCRDLSSCRAVSRLSRCCRCPAGCRWSCRGTSLPEQTRCGWHRKRPSRRTPSPCAASSPDRRRRHSPRRDSASLPDGAEHGEGNTQGRTEGVTQRQPVSSYPFLFAAMVSCLSALFIGSHVCCVSGGSERDRRVWAHREADKDGGITLASV